jgi:hypothetical protein
MAFIYGDSFFFFFFLSLVFCKLRRLHYGKSYQAWIRSAGRTRNSGPGCIFNFDFTGYDCGCELI